MIFCRVPSLRPPLFRELYESIHWEVYESYRRWYQFHFKAVYQQNPRFEDHQLMARLSRLLDTPIVRNWARDISRSEVNGSTISGASWSFTHPTCLAPSVSSTAHPSVPPFFFPLISLAHPSVFVPLHPGHISGLHSHAVMFIFHLHTLPRRMTMPHTPRVGCDTGTPPTTTPCRTQIGQGDMKLGPNGE